MMLKVTLKMALRSLLANKLRSFLAMLGIIIGVGAVISMLAIGAGAKKQIMTRISAMGTNILMVNPGQEGFHGVRSDQDNLTLDDAEALMSSVPAIQQISPVVRGNTQLKYYNKNARVDVMGTAMTFAALRNYAVEKGRFFSEAEVGNMARVVVLGPTTADNLGFLDTDIGDLIKLKGISFRVIGILKEKGGQGFFNPDDIAIIPYTTAMKVVFGLDNLREIDIQAKANFDLTKVENDVAKVLRKEHKLRPEQENNFHVRNQADIIETASEFNKTFTMLLGSIASISLLVGGIGIMNIMLVTVTERTREIGVRKAIGAKDRDILRQFLIESVIMSGIGGLIGVAAGVGSSLIIDKVSEFTTYIELPAIILSLSFAMIVGVFFGYYPARRAAMLDPIKSLYYE